MVETAGGHSLPDRGADHFETLRRQRETKNERIINYLQLAQFTAVLGANLGTRLFPSVAPYQASIPLLSLIVASLGMRLALLWHLSGEPVYWRARKHVIGALDLVIFTGASLLLGWQGAYPWLFLGVFSVCIYSILIVLAGLRYSSLSVLWTTVAAIVLHGAIFPWLAPPKFALPVLFVGIVTLAIVGAAMSHLVSSLILLHSEAALKDSLSRFLAPELVEEVARRPEVMLRRTERRTATVLFTDIRGFTRLSERLEPEQVVEFLNAFLEEMTSAILDNQGMLDKYIGDAVMGVFGVPFLQEQHAERGFATALDMRRRLEALNRGLDEKGLPQLSIGIGLHTGELLIGSIGSTRRLDYTVIGDTVNVASRIEGMTRSYPVEILVSDATRRRLSTEAHLHRIATVKVKNRNEPLLLWSPDAP